MRKSQVNGSEILMISSFPPRECGIATFTQNLIEVIENKFKETFALKICALESTTEQFQYPEQVAITLNTDVPAEYEKIESYIHHHPEIKVVVIQHEFGFFHHQEEAFQNFLFKVNSPVILVFHTVLPHPDPDFKSNVEMMVSACTQIVVMTHNSKEILAEYYDIPKQKITIIPHGTHLVLHKNVSLLKKIAGFKDRKILSTFGLLNEGKSIETTLNALPDIIRNHPDVVFLILGKTHPVVLEREGEAYREMLKQKINELKLWDHVYFVNKYLELPELLDYLQMTDVYLFTSKDPNQAVSGTFSYAMSCGCAIVSTPIPHAVELLNDNKELFFDFGNSAELAKKVNHLLDNEGLKKKIVINGLQKIVATAWENVAISYALLFRKLSGQKEPLLFKIPNINLKHFKHLTTDFGMIQFAQINQPDETSGYTIDDNARALIAICQHFELSKSKESRQLMEIYLNFIGFCQQQQGSFLNYVNYEQHFSDQNHQTNLEDSNGRTIWALGYLISRKNLPKNIIDKAEQIFRRSIPILAEITSPRALSFIVKGLFYYNQKFHSLEISNLIRKKAQNLVQIYSVHSEKGWEWFEPYLTYANSILPEAMLCAYQETMQLSFKKIACESFDFLLAKTFVNNKIKVISNQSWLFKGEESATYGEQPIDVAYTILALDRFYQEFKVEDYKNKMIAAFNWFLGDNHLHQIIYNPCTGGCYDGLEEFQVNLNQGAESTVSYLMARLVMEKYHNQQKILQTQLALRPGAELLITKNDMETKTFRNDES